MINDYLLLSGSGCLVLVAKQHHLFTTSQVREPLIRLLYSVATRLGKSGVIRV